MMVKLYRQQMAISIDVLRRKVPTRDRPDAGKSRRATVRL